MSSTEGFTSQIPIDHIQNPAIAEALIRPQDTVVSFTTSHGSVYSYDTDGLTTRFKTKTGIEQPKQDITIFIDVGVIDAGTIAAGYLLRSSTETTRIEVVEQQPDGSLKVVNHAKEITDPEQLQVVTLRGERVIKSKHASLFPKIGLYVYDSRRFEKDGTTKTERHLGHKVSSIQYKK